MDTNQETGIVPVTEDNMREYFQAVVTKFVSLSEQAARVETLTGQVNDLSARITNLETENVNLRREVEETWQYAHKVEAESQGLSSALAAAEQHVQALRDTIVQRDTAVSTLTQSLETEKSAHQITTGDRDDARQHVSELQLEVESLKSRLESMTKDRDHWLDTANNHYNEREQFREKLDNIQRFLNPAVVPFPQSQSA